MLVAQELLECGQHEEGGVASGEEETYNMGARSIDIWKDATCLRLLKEGIIPGTVDLEESKKARKE